MNYKEILLSHLFFLINKKWWREKDSNLRRLSRQIYSLLPLAARESLHANLGLITRDNGADYRNRTDDLLITSQLLYLLS